MSDAFNTALCRATQLSKPKEEEKTSIKIFSMAGGGGLSSVQKRIDIGGEPHRLAYINSDEASLLKQLGGSGQNINGVPAYYMGDEEGATGFGQSWSDPGDGEDSSDSQDIVEAVPISPQVQANPSGLESGLLAPAGPGYASLPPSPPPGGLDFIGPLTIDQARGQAAILEALQEQAKKEERDAKWSASAKKERSKVPDRVKDPKAHKEYIEAEMAAKKAARDALNRYYWTQAPVFRVGIDIRETDHEKIAGSPNIPSITDLQKNTGTDNPFFGVEREDGTIDWYGPLGSQKDEENTWEFWNPNPLAYAFQTQTVHGVGAPKTYEEYMDIAEAGIPSSAMGIMDPQAPESYFHAQQLVLQEMIEARRKEEEELEEENKMRRAAGWLEIDKPEKGWKTVDPDKYDDPFMSFIHGIAGFMRRGIPLLGAINFAQRMGGSGEHGMEIQGIEDKIAGGAALASLTGYYGPSLSRETREAEKADEKARLAGTESPSLPEILKKQKEKKDKPEEFKKLGRMKKYFEEKDEKEKKKLLKQFTKDEQKAILDLEKMNQIG